MSSLRPPTGEDETAPRWVSLADRLNPKRPALFDPVFQTKWKQMSKAERKRVIDEDKKQIQQFKKRGKTQLPFEADPDDHCETSPTAYKDIVPLLQLLGNRLQEAKQIGTSTDVRIYDPYYCAGGTAKHLQALGFNQVYNQPEDFYQVIAEKSQPKHDVILSNPPYSGSHFDRLLEFLESKSQRQTPFMLLLPSHFAQRPAFQKFARRDSCVYLTPRERYHYWTPEGRREGETEGSTSKKRKHKNLHLGSRNSPFYSYWFVCLEPIVSRDELLAMYSDGKLLELTQQGCQLHRDPVEVSGANQAFHHNIRSGDSVNGDDKDNEESAVDERKKKKKGRRREKSDGGTSSNAKQEAPSRNIVLSDDDNPFLPPDAQPLT